MPQKEYEVIVHNQMQFMNLFLVRLSHRTSHIHQEFELGLLLSGDLTVKTEEGGTAFLTEGDLFLINPMETHEFVSSRSGALILTIQFSPSFLADITPDIRSLRFGHGVRIRDYFAGKPNAYDKLRMVCFELAFLYFMHAPGYAYQCLSLVAMLFSALQLNLPWEIQSEQKVQALQSRTKRLFRIISFIEQNFQRKLLLGELAKEEHLSLTYCSHYFKDAFGMTFQDYVNTKRLEYACELLGTTKRSILDISIESGFSDVRYLNRMFQNLYGCSPKKYRNGLRNSGKSQAALLDTVQFIYSPEESLPLVEKFRTDLKKRAGREFTFEEFFEP